MKKLDLKQVAMQRRDGYSKDLTGLKEQEDTDALLQKLRGLVNKVVDLPLKHITLAENVRRNLSKEDADFDKLVNSIRKNGLLQNLVASLIEYDDGRWELRLVAGERRYHACTEAGLERAPVLIRLWDSAVEEIYTGVTENEERVNLNALDLADAFARLVKLGQSVDEIAERAKREKRTIRKYLHLAGLPDEIRKIVDARPDVFTTRVLFNHVASRSFASDDELRNYIQGLIDEKERDSMPPAASESAGENGQAASGEVSDRSRTARKVDPALIEEVVGCIANNLPVKVKVKGTRDRGRIVINYASSEQLAQLLSRFQS